MSKAKTNLYLLVLITTTWGYVTSSNFSFDCLIQQWCLAPWRKLILLVHCQIPITQCYTLLDTRAVVNTYIASCATKQTYHVECYIPKYYKIHLWQQPGGNNLIFEVMMVLCDDWKMKYTAWKSPGNFLFSTCMNRDYTF